MRSSKYTQKGNVQYSGALLTIVIVLLSIPSITVAQSKDVGSAVTKKNQLALPGVTYQIDAILIEGLGRTKPKVVTRELLFGEGDRATHTEIEESVQRLRNLGIFRIAEYALEDRRIPLPDGTYADQSDNVEHRILVITVDERWTIIPFASFSRGGGTFSINLGILDGNLFGSYIEAGGEYIRFGETNSFGAWLFDRRFLDERLFAGVAVYQTNRIQYFFDNDTGEVEDASFRLRRSMTLSVNREWFPWLRTGLSAFAGFDKFGLDFVPDDIVERSVDYGDQRLISLSATLGLGRVNSNSFLKDGWSLVTTVSGADPTIGATQSVATVGTELKAYKTLPLKSTLAARIGTGATTTDFKPYQLFVGGFGEVRGFLHRRFRGKQYWYANTEFRIPSIDTRWFLLQHIFFADAAHASLETSEFFDVSGVSTGVGVRLISPKILGFVARFDYAFPLVGAGGNAAISFGSQQFF